MVSDVRLYCYLYNIRETLEYRMYTAKEHK